MKPTSLVAVVMTVCAATPSEAVTVEKIERYFELKGNSAEDLFREFNGVGPFNKVTKVRTPSSTDITFSPDVRVGSTSNLCRITVAEVALKFQFLQPLWKPSGRPDRSTELYFERVKRDVASFQARQVRIAEQAARNIERSIRSLRPRRDCRALVAEARGLFDVGVKANDAAQTKLILNWRR